MAADARPGTDIDTEAGALATPVLRARLLAWLAVATLGFIATAITLLWLFFRLTVGGAPFPPLDRFVVSPRLETTIDPRVWPAVQRGAAEAHPPHPPMPTPASAALIDKAMAAVAAKGAHGYDPVAAPAGAHGGGP